MSYRESPKFSRVAFFPFIYRNLQNINNYVISGHHCLRFPQAAFANPGRLAAFWKVNCTL